MGPVSFHLFLASEKNYTLNIFDTNELEKKLQNFLMFHLRQNVFDIAQLKVTGLFAPVFNLTAYTTQNTR